jgi:hypothetical protein
MSSVGIKRQYFRYTIWFGSTNGGAQNVAELCREIGEVTWSHPSPGVHDCLATNPSAFLYFQSVWSPYGRNMIYPVHDDLNVLQGYFKIDHLGDDEFQILTYDTLMAAADIDMDIKVECQVWLYVPVPC